MEKDYDKRIVNLMGLVGIITASVVTFLLWYFLGGKDGIFAIGMASGAALGTFIAWILIRGYLIRSLKEKRRQKNQVVVMRQNKTIG